MRLGHPPSSAAHHPTLNTVAMASPPSLTTSLLSNSYPPATHCRIPADAELGPTCTVRRPLAPTSACCRSRQCPVTSHADGTGQNNGSGRLRATAVNCDPPPSSPPRRMRMSMTLEVGLRTTVCFDRRPRGSPCRPLAPPPAYSPRWRRTRGPGARAASLPRRTPARRNSPTSVPVTASAGSPLSCCCG